MNTYDARQTNSPADPTDTGLDQEISLLRELVEIESPSLHVESSERIAESLSAHFTAAGGIVRRIPTEVGTHLVIDVPGSGRPLLLIGHTDTVWPIGTLAESVPWSHSGDTITGAGVFDMKSGIVVMLAALSKVRNLPHRAARIVLVCDEEVGSPTSSDLIRQQSKGAAGAIGFESPHPDGALKIGRRGSTRLELHAKGKAAHAALDPEQGVSAIDELVDQLIRLRSIVNEFSPPHPILCNVGTLSGGTRTNVVPEHARAEVGLRFFDEASETATLAAIQTLAPIRDGARVEARVLTRRPAWRATEQDRALLAEIAVAGASIGLRIAGRPADGAGDTNLLGALGVPTVDGFGPRGFGAHARQERISIRSLRDRIDLLTAVLTSE